MLRRGQAKSSSDLLADLRAADALTRSVATEHERDVKALLRELRSVSKEAAEAAERALPTPLTELARRRVEMVRRPPPPGSAPAEDSALEWIARAAGSVATGIKEGARRAGSPFRGRPAGGSTPGGAKTPGAKTPGAKTPGAKTPMKGPTSAREQSPARGRR